MAFDPQTATDAHSPEYRYPLAGPIEETLFYNHPTVRNRVLSAMEWKAANGAHVASEEP